MEGALEFLTSIIWKLMKNVNKKARYFFRVAGGKRWPGCSVAETNVPENPRMDGMDKKNQDKIQQKQQFHQGPRSNGPLLNFEARLQVCYKNHRVGSGTTEFDASSQMLLVTGEVPNSIGWVSNRRNEPTCGARHVHHIARCSTFWSKQSTHGVTCTRRASHRWRPIPSRCAFGITLLTKSLPLLSILRRRRQLKRLPVWGKESAEEKLAAPKWKQSYQQRALWDDPDLIQIYSLEYRLNSSRMYRISFESLVNSIETTICMPKIRVAPDTPNTKA